MLKKVLVINKKLFIIIKLNISKNSANIQI